MASFYTRSYHTMVEHKANEAPIANYKHFYFAFMTVGAGGLLFGFVIGSLSDVVTTCQLLYDDSCACTLGSYFSFGYGQCYDLNSYSQSFVTSLVFVGAIISSVISYVFSDRMGRRCEIQVAAGLYCLGALCAAASPVLVGIMTGFFIYGLGIGFSLHATPIYISEISTDELREKFVTGKEFLIMLGLLLGFLFGFIFSYIHIYGWRYILCIASLGAFAMGLCSTFLPRSPEWLMLQAMIETPEEIVVDKEHREAPDYNREALLALSFFRSDSSNVEREMELFRNTVSAKLRDEVCEKKVGSLFSEYLSCTFIAIGLITFMQLGGGPSVDVEATNIFKSAGFADTSANLMSVGLGLLKFLATALVMLSINQLGARMLLLAGIATMCCGYALLTVGFGYVECTDSGSNLWDCSSEGISVQGSWNYVILVAVYFVGFGFQASYGPIVWLVGIKIFPLQVRGKGVSLMLVIVFILFVLMLWCENMIFSTSMRGAFAMYLVSSLIGAGFVVLVVPERQGSLFEDPQSHPSEEL